jgi:hypothetical protein
MDGVVTDPYFYKITYILWYVTVDVNISTLYVRLNTYTTSLGQVVGVLLSVIYLTQGKRENGSFGIYFSTRSPNRPWSGAKPRAKQS